MGKGEFFLFFFDKTRKTPKPSEVSSLSFMQEPSQRSPQAFASRITLSPGGTNTCSHRFPLSITSPCGPCSHTELRPMQDRADRFSSLSLPPSQPCKAQEGCVNLKACKSLPINLALLSCSFSPRDLYIPSLLSKLFFKSMTVKVSSGIDLCKLYGLSSPGISMVSAVSPLLRLPRMLHNHFQVPSCSLTQGCNSDCHPLCLRGPTGSSQLPWGPAPRQFQLGGRRCKGLGAMVPSQLPSWYWEIHPGSLGDSGLSAEETRVFLKIIYFTSTLSN